MTHKGITLPLSEDEKKRIKESKSNRKMPAADMPQAGTPQADKIAAVKSTPLAAAVNAINAAADTRKVNDNGTIGKAPLSDNVILTAVCEGEVKFNSKWNASPARVSVTANLINYEKFLVDRHVQLAIGSIFTSPWDIRIEYGIVPAAKDEAVKDMWIKAAYHAIDNTWNIIDGINEDGNHIAAAAFQSSTSKVHTSARFHFDHAIRNLLPYLSASFAHAAAVPAAAKNAAVIESQLSTLELQIIDTAKKIVRATKAGTPIAKLEAMIARQKARRTKLNAALKLAAAAAANEDVSEDEIAALIA